jgi:cellulose biosynthesis protein BcsQ
MGKIIAIGNQKGGCGKSTMTSFVANYLYSEFKDKGLKVLVVDADDLQNSLYKVRQEELNMSEDPDIENKCYELIRMDSKDLAKNIETLRSEYDLVFVDLPGNLKQEGVISVYAYVDALFIPVESSKLAIDSTVDFIEFYNNLIVKKRNEMGFKTIFTLFFNRVNERNKDFKELYNARESFGVDIMENYIPESIPTFQRRVSTIYKYSSETKGEYSKFIDEFLGFLNRLN